jgi:hypothetical protein
LVWDALIEFDEYDQNSFHHKYFVIILNSSLVEKEKYPSPSTGQIIPRRHDPFLGMNIMDASHLPDG